MRLSGAVFAHIHLSYLPYALNVGFILPIKEEVAKARDQNLDGAITFTGIEIRTIQQIVSACLPEFAQVSDMVREKREEKWTIINPNHRY